MASFAARRFAVGATFGVSMGIATMLRRAPVVARCEEPASARHGTVPTDENARICHKKTWGVPWIDDWDNPVDRKLPTQSRNVKRQIILVRHGQYQNESASKKDEDHFLTDLGRRQAEETGKYLAACIGSSPLYRAKTVSAVYVSDLQRARQTCDLMLQGMPGVAPAMPTAVDPLLREIFPCDPQPPYPKKARPESERIIEAAFGKYFHRPTESESNVEVIVAHGNVIRYFLCRALQVPPEAWLRFNLPHCSVTSITIDGRGFVSVGAVGSVNHLAPAEQSLMNVA
jgi:serine/threonine-protein phosphatase PGAM5